MTNNYRELVATVNALLLVGARMGVLFDPIKLQKLIYLHYVVHLQNGGEFLDYLPFEAWDWGPVIPAVYYHYKHRGFKGKDIIRKKMPYGDEYPVLENDKSIRETLERYGDFAPFELVYLTHQPDGAWHEAYDLGYNMFIDHRAIKKEFANEETANLTPKDRLTSEEKSKPIKIDKKLESGVKNQFLRALPSIIKAFETIVSYLNESD